MSEEPQQARISNDRYLSEVIPRLHEVLREILKEFDRVCRELGLTYWVEAGALIGLMRNGGMIPWDDDVDVSMEISDWREFCAAAPEILHHNYQLVTWETVPGFSPLWVCLGKRGTRFIDADHKDAVCDQPIFIDIFPFIPQEKDPKRAKKQAFRLRFWQAVSYARAIRSPHNITGIKRLPYALLRVYASGIEQHEIAKRFWKAAEVHDPSDLLIDAAYADWPPTPRDVIFPVKRALLDGVEVNIPHDPERYLDIEYGSWRKVPKEEDRYTHAPLILDVGDGKNMLAPDDA